MSRVEHTSRPLMPAHRIFFHLTWSTLARRPMINAPTRTFLDEYFRKIALQERATIVCLGFLQTHAHLLIRTGPRFDLPRLVQLLKGGISYAASRQPGKVLGLRWSREDSLMIVCPKLRAQAVAYIESHDGAHPS